MPRTLLAALSALLALAAGECPSNKEADRIASINASVTGCRAELTVSFVPSSVGGEVYSYTGTNGVSLKLIGRANADAAWVEYGQRDVRPDEFEMDVVNAWGPFTFNLDEQAEFRALIIDRATAADTIVGTCATNRSGTAEIEYRHWDNEDLLVTCDAPLFGPGALGIALGAAGVTLLGACGMLLNRVCRVRVE